MRSAPYRSGPATALTVVTLFATFGCAQVVPEAADPPQPSTAETQLDAYRPGMNLRQTFDSLSQKPHRARVELLKDNVAAWTARWRLLAGARDSIDVDYFIFSQDVFGLAFIGHLLKKAHEGVRVRIQLDAQGMRMAVQPYGLDCWAYVAASENVSLRIHRSLSRRMLEALATLEPTLATASDHDKMLVVDRRASVIGGRNIEAKYFADHDDLEHAFYDLDVVLRSRALGATFTTVFEATYESERVTAIEGDAGAAERCPAALRLAYQAVDDWLDDRPTDPAMSREMESLQLPWAAELRRFPSLKGAGARATPLEQVSATTRVPAAAGAARRRLHRQPRQWLWPRHPRIQASLDWFSLRSLSVLHGAGPTGALGFVSFVRFVVKSAQ